MVLQKGVDSEKTTSKQKKHKRNLPSTIKNVINIFQLWFCSKNLSAMWHSKYFQGSYQNIEQSDNKEKNI